jgi:hypothetical protein
MSITWEIRWLLPAIAMPHDGARVQGEGDRLSEIGEYECELRCLC